jgi:hypothetical protein
MGKRFLTCFAGQACAEGCEERHAEVPRNTSIQSHSWTPLCAAFRPRSAPIDRTMSTFLALHTPVTSAPNHLAI